MYRGIETPGLEDSGQPRLERKLLRSVRGLENCDRTALCSCSKDSPCGTVCHRGPWMEDASKVMDACVPVRKDEVQSGKVICR